MSLKRNNLFFKWAWYKYIGLIIVPFALIIFFCRQHQFALGSRYTITTTIRLVSTLKNGTEVGHKYAVNGKDYIDFFNTNDHYKIIYPNGRYIVRFAVSDPSVSEVLWNKQVLENIKQSPLEGWNYIPF